MDPQAEPNEVMKVDEEIPQRKDPTTREEQTEATKRLPKSIQNIQRDQKLGVTKEDQRKAFQPDRSKTTATPGSLEITTKRRRISTKPSKMKPIKV